MSNLPQNKIADGKLAANLAVAFARWLIELRRAFTDRSPDEK